MAAASASEPSEGFCCVCGSSTNFRPREHESEKESADWYASRLEWALESSIPCEWICLSCDQLLKTASQLEDELSAVLAALQQRHGAAQASCPGIEPTNLRSCPTRLRQNSISPVQVGGPPLGPKDVLISIWTDHPTSPRTDHQQGNVPESVEKRGEPVQNDGSTPAPEREGNDGGREKRDEDGTQPSEGARQRMTTRLPCGDRSRPSCTACTLNYHWGSTHRSRHGSDSRAMGESECDEEQASEDDKRMATNGLSDKSEENSVRLANVDELTMTRNAGREMKRTEGPDSSVTEHTDNESVRNISSDPTESHGAVKYAIQPCASIVRDTDFRTIASDAINASNASMKPSSVDFRRTHETNPPPWLQTDSLEADCSAKPSCIDFLPGSVLTTSSSLVSSAVSTDLDDGRRLFMPNIDPAPESLGNADAILERPDLPNFSTDLSTVSPDLDAPRSSTTTYVNEHLDIAPEKSRELYISFDTDMELSCNAATNAEQKSSSTFGSSVQQKEEIHANPADGIILGRSDGGVRLIDPEAKTALTSRVVTKQTTLENGDKMVGATTSPPSKAKQKKSASGTGRPRLALYERHGQKWRCLECSALFTSRTGAHGHALTHSEPDGGRCPRCGKSYANAYALRRHRASCLSGQTPSCPVCGKCVADAAYLTQHMLTHSADAPKKHQCDRCGLAFANGSRLRVHLATKHGAETPHQCDICRRAFKVQSQLRRHCRTAHAAAPAVRCEICGKGFNRADHLRAHMLVHSEARPFVCAECGKGFTRADSLADHVRIHTGERPYKCALCPEAFREHRGYRRHVKTKHDNTESGVGGVSAG